MPEREENQYAEDYRCIGHCPHGEIGDRLWVQEDGRVGARRHDYLTFAIDYKASRNLINISWLKFDDLFSLEILEEFEVK